MTRFAALILAFAIAMPVAHAQPKPALVQDVDAIGRNAWQHAIGTNDCGGEVFCQVDFEAVPLGYRLVLVQVTVETSVSVGADPLFLRVAPPTLNARASYTVSGPSPVRIATFPVTLVLNPGSIPRVTVSTPTSLTGSVFVSLVGYLVAV